VLNVTSADIIGLVIAALGGAAVGLERQWSGHAQGPRARFAGIRTFTMLGAIGGLAGTLWGDGLVALATVLLAGAVTMTVAAYVAGSRHDVDGTTEVAAVVVIGAGTLAGLGAYRVASGIVAITSLLLVEKSRLHALVARIDDIGLRAGARFAVMALVVLPLLPAGPFGPLGGVRPRELWALVLFFSGLSFVGYLARSLVGPGHGYFVTGVLGGLISSTNVTFTFARTSRAHPDADAALAFGAVGANAMLFPRVLAATAVLNPSLVAPVAAYLAPPGVLAAAIAAIGLLRPARDQVTAPAVTNPLQLGAALQMAILFQGVLMLVHVARSAWGQAGIFSTAAVLGLTDVDALTMSMARGVAPAVSLPTAAMAIAIGILSNTGLKLAVAAILGSPRFRLIAGGALAGVAVAGAAALLSFPA
jgi:uncharacterized membrane protein (DUF4010 family)